MEEPQATPQTIDPIAQEQADLIARRNSMVKELFRITPKIHPPARRPVGEVPHARPRVEAKVIDKKDLDLDIRNKPVPPAKPTDAKKEIKPADTTRQKQIEADERDRRMHSVNGIHLDVYEYFSMPTTATSMENLRRLQFIDTWVATEAKSFAEGMRKLHKIDTKLGSADSGETKLIKLYNWIRFSGGR